MATAKLVFEVHTPFGGPGPAAGAHFLGGEKKLRAVGNLYNIVVICTAA